MVQKCSTQILVWIASDMIFKNDKSLKRAILKKKPENKIKKKEID
jgi:hypothetical protein